MFKKYIEYLKDNPNHYWFKRKLFGWGWTPATIEGWMVTLFYFIFIAYLIIVKGKELEPTAGAGDALRIIILPLLLSTFLFIWIAYKKGEKPEWQWGLDKRAGDKEDRFEN